MDDKKFPCDHPFCECQKQGCDCKAIAATQAAPQPTDLSKILRDMDEFSTVDFPLLKQAADEIERYYGGMLAWKRTAEAKDREFSAAQAAPNEVRLTPLNEDTQDILGRPNFTCISIAQRLRELGRDIKNRAENEQAAVVHFLLNMYEQHGADWRERANEYLRTASTPTEGGA